MDEIKRVLENNDCFDLHIGSETDPSDGSVSLFAKMTNGYTDETYFELSWYYDFDELMRDVNLKCAAL